MNPSATFLSLVDQLVFHGKSPTKIMRNLEIVSHKANPKPAESGGSA